MASVNKVIIVGNLGRDPEMRTFPSGGQIANVRIATTDRWRDKTTGENREITEWHSVVFSDRLAEIAGQYLRKGSSVYVEGSLRTRKWTDQNGQERYSTDIRAHTMQLLGGRTNATSSTSSTATADDQGYAATYGGDSQRSTSPQQTAMPPAARPAPAPTPAAVPQGGGSGFEDLDDDIPF